MTKWIRVLVVDDCEMLYAGIRRALTCANCEIVGEACDGATALALIERERPDIVLLDCRLPDLCGREIAQLARARGYTARMVAYSAHAEYADVMGMLKSGAVGYIVKNESSENLCAAIAAVARGETWFSQCIAKKLAEWAQAAPVSAVELTAQETNILRLLARGKSDAEITAELKIAPRTLRHHLQNVMEKIGAQERTQAVVWALENGLGEKRLRETQESYAADEK